MPQQGPGYGQGPDHGYGAGYAQGPGAGGDQGYGQAPGFGPGQGNGKPRNVIAIVALVAAIVGFIFAVWEGAFLVGWILLPIAFVLSLVALFQNGKPKKLAVAALIISIIGTIAGAVAFLGSAFNAFENEFNPETTVSEPAVEVTEPGVEETDVPAEETIEEATPEETTQEDSASGESGSRTNPAPLGSTLSSPEWEVTVNSFTPDATAEVMAENQFNEDPDAGSVYALINVTIKRVAAEPGYPLDVSVGYVTESGNVVNTFDSMVVVPDDLGNANELYEGAEATGNVVVMIPEGGAGTIRVTPGFLGDDVFIATA